MKAMYLVPQVEVMAVAGNTMMTQQISGPEGLKDGGQAGGTVVPKAPERPF